MSTGPSSSAHTSASPSRTERTDEGGSHTAAGAADLEPGDPEVTSTEATGSQPAATGATCAEAAATEATTTATGTETPSPEAPTPEAVSPGAHRRALRRARALGLQTPKPRLRGMIHLITFPTVLIVGLLLVALGHDLPTRLACAVLVVTAGLLFGISATYHRGTWRPEHALMLRRFDHANIFLIIAGTYTPIAVALLPPHDATILLTIAWAGAALGVAFRLFWTAAPRWLYVPAYVALGWIAVFYMPQMLTGGGWAVVSLIAAGGLFYTVGAVVYGLKRPNPSPTWFGFHEIFHACTVAGFACHFIAVAIAVISPAA